MNQTATTPEEKQVEFVPEYFAFNGNHFKTLPNNKAMKVWGDGSSISMISMWTMFAPDPSTPEAFYNAFRRAQESQNRAALL